MKTCIAVALSGGVDSLTAAQLLKEKGADVIGLHFITGFESGAKTDKPLSGNFMPLASTNRLRTETEKKLNPISKQLDIPLVVLDLREEFEKCVVNHFVDTYRLGKTPNPCLVCNPSIKFGTLLNHARKMGADKLATGHYARIKKDFDGNIHLLSGLDPVKDQSYFLAFMNRNQLDHACFPLGGMNKTEVIHMAAQKGLVPITKKESQDICFIKGVSYGEFLTRYFAPKPGPIENTSGKKIGRHGGLHLFTVGQRRGINCPSSDPYYVVRIDTENNRLVVGFKHELYCRECRVEGINWIRDIPGTSMNMNTRVRYRHRAAPSIVVPLDRNTAMVRFEKPQEAVTPGQGAVFYVNDEVIGGGWIAGKNP